MKINKYISFPKYLIFAPLLIYIGDRSPIAFDEGFYILQSKWILETGNWIAPMWWGNISLDRTIGIQYLIAFSQKIFGQNSFATYLPTTLSAGLMLFLTYKIHILLSGKKYALISPLILSTTFLWLNYSHLATQDIIFSALTTLGIFSSINFSKYKSPFICFLCGLWMGLAFMLKTYLVCIPILALTPYLLKIKIFSKKYFWFGLLVGFLPFFAWGYSIISNYGFETLSGLYKKLLTLSNKNNFTNPFYYYLWNLPINLFPWSIFSIFGFLKAYKLKNFTSKYFLFYYPIISLGLLSLFSTKTPYYPIQILSLISINTTLGIIYILDNNLKLNVVIRYLSFVGIPILFLSGLIYLNLPIANIFIEDKNKFLINIAFLSFSFSWLFILFINNLKNKLALILLGPYILFSIMIQSGQLTDRSKNIRLATEELIKSELISNKNIRVLVNDINLSSQPNIIKIAVLLPNKFIPIENKSELKNNQYFLTTQSLDLLNKNNNFFLVDASKEFEPWKLMLKKK